MHSIEYNRDGKDKQYLSIVKHMANVHNNRAKWISVNVERNVFDISDSGHCQLENGHPSWVGNNGSLWGFQEGFLTIGIDKEQFGFFEKPNNPVDRWHGFPIIPFSQPRYYVPDELIARWVFMGYLDVDDIGPLKNKKRI